MILQPHADPMGAAIYDYFTDGEAGPLVVHSSMFEDDEIPVEGLFREFEDMPEASILCGLSPSALAALRYIITAPDSKIFSFELKDESEMNELSKATESYILNHLERGFDSLEFYKSVK